MSGGLPQAALELALRASVLLLPALVFALASRRSSAAVRHAVCFLGILTALVMPFLMQVVPDLRIAVLPAATPNVGHAAAAPMQAWIGPVLAPALALVWLLGATVVFIRVLGGVSRARALCRRATLVTDARVLSAVIRVRRELGIDMPFRVLSQRSLDTPFTWGLLRPVVLLPRGAKDWSRGRLRAVLLHELSHARRRDCLTQLVADFACAVYWFHPLVWFAALRMRVERERACDDTVVVVGGRASGYAVLLLRMVKGIHGGAHPARPGAAATFADGGGLAGRLRALLGRARDRRSLSPAAVAAFTLGALTLALPVAAVELCSRAPAPSAESAPAFAHVPAAAAARPGPLRSPVSSPMPSTMPSTEPPTARLDLRVEHPGSPTHRTARIETPDEPAVETLERRLEEMLTPLTGRPVKVRRADPDRPRPARAFVGTFAGFTVFVEFTSTDDSER